MRHLLKSRDALIKSKRQRLALGVGPLFRTLRPNLLHVSKSKCPTSLRSSSTQAKVYPRAFSSHQFPNKNLRVAEISFFLIQQDTDAPVDSAAHIWFMAGATSSFYLQPRTGSGLDPQRASWFAVKLLSTKSKSGAYCERGSHSELALGEGPSCIFVGPIETASKETLEALYRQARDAYYSGKPLIVDDMFDKVELKLRWYGSKSVVKYPRCSLRRQSTYADAEEDPSQVFALASVWIILLTFSSLAFLVPVIYTAGLAYRDAFDANPLSDDTVSRFQFLATVNGILSMVFGSVICYPIALASVRALQRLWRNDLVALKGACPNCGEEVFAFVATDQSNQTPHRADCHVCESALEFRPKVEQSISGPSKGWVYGRIYLLRQRRRYQSKRWM